jgi:hypothetical protein
MAIPRGESGARLDTAAGRAAEAAFQQRKAAEIAQAAMRVAQAEAEAGRAAEAQRAMAAAQAAAQNAAPVVQQAVQTHTQQLVTGGSGAPPVPAPTPQAQPSAPAQPAAPQQPSAPAQPGSPAQPSAPAQPGFAPIRFQEGGREVTLDYARQVEDRVNKLLAEGKIEEATAQARNITGGGQGVQNVLIRLNTAIDAATKASQGVPQTFPGAGAGDTGEAFEREREKAEREGYDVFTGEPRTPVTPEPPGTGPGSGVGDYDYETDPDTLRMREQQAWEERQRQLQKDDEARQVIAVVTGIFNEYGLGSLIPVITRYAQQGYNADAVMVLLRETPEYKARFPAMAALSAKKRGISEAAYIEYERTSAALERQYGLPMGMLMNNVTTLLSNEVSLQELNERVVLASAASVNAPEGLKETFRDFYGVDALTAYFLDPDVAKPLLDKQYATAQIGLEARRQNVGLQVDMATQLQELGLSAEQTRAGFQQVRRFEGLSTGRGDTVRQPRMIQGVFGDQDAAKDIERAQSSRLGRFQGGGGLVMEREGVSGLAPTQR